MAQSLVLLISGWYLEEPVFRQCVYKVEESGIVLPSARISSESLPDAGICLAFCGIAEYCQEPEAIKKVYPKMEEM